MNNTQKDILSDIYEEPKPTSIGKRIAAAMIDGLILLVVFIILGNLFGSDYERTTTTTTTVTTTSESANPMTTHEVTTSSGFHLEGWPALAFMVCWFFLIPFSEGSSGQTIGKRALRIKVVRLNGDPASIGTSIVRHLFDCVDFFLLIGLIIASLNLMHKRIGDLTAGTYVVDKL